VGTLIIVNRFVSRGVLKKIEGSMNELSAGLRHLREGELDFRLPDRQADEFSAVRADFNATAQRLQQLVESERQSEKNRQELLAGISHDLRSPLTAIRAYAEGLLDGVAQNDESRNQYLTIIRDKARDLQGLVNKLFLFSRMDLGRNEDHPEPVALKAELTLLKESLAPEYAEKGMAITLAAEGEGRVLADPETLQRIVSNIAENFDEISARMRTLVYKASLYDEMALRQAEIEKANKRLAEQRENCERLRERLNAEMARMEEMESEINNLTA
jgi:signal transduction histidine kinase